MRYVLAAVGCAALLAGCAPEEMTIETMDDLGGWKPVTWGLKESPAEVTLELDTSAAEGKGALRVIGHAGSIYTLGSKYVQATPLWNGYDGLAFKVKGDGSENFGCVRVRSKEFNNSWIGTFPLTDENWHEVRLAWGDFTPAGGNPELASANGAMPSDLDNVAFGKSWTFDPQHTKPEIVMSVDDLRLVRPLKASRRRVSIDTFPPVPAVVAAMQAGRDVTILALGDSITAEPGDRAAYPRQIARMLRKRYANDRITVVNAAIGGSTTQKARQWMLRDVAGIQADLVTIMFGFNEQPSSSDVEGSTDKWIERMVTYLEEVAALMDSPPACVILATIPGRDQHWRTLDPYAAAVRKLAEDKRNIAVADVSAHFKAMGKSQYAAYMGDEAHPNKRGQAEMAKVVFEAIVNAR